jgi:RNA 3'-terminal phosphate cyclase (ATP)
MIEITNIRANRQDPGLGNQHCAAVQAVAGTCDANISGCRKGSTHIRFTPGEIRPREIRIDIGTAGSIPLVLQAWIPVALREGGSIIVSGGTEVWHSPTIDYMAQVFIPVLCRFGASVDLGITRRGYYPRGGGNVTMQVSSSRLSPIILSEKDGRAACGICSCSSNLPDHVTSRQARSAEDVLGATLGMSCPTTIDRRTGESTGSSCTVWAGTKGGSSLGRRGLRAERVGEQAAYQLLDAMKKPGEVDEYLSDQLLIYIAQYQGRYSTHTRTMHALTMCWLLGLFGYRITGEGEGKVTYSA